jgi:integrase
MSVRKRVWRNRDGSQGEAWVVSYTDGGGKRRLKTFERKRDAESFEDGVGVDVRSGIHVPDSKSVTVAEAAKLWLISREEAGIERATLATYRARVRLHIVPLIGAVKLSQLTVPRMRAFEDELRRDRSQSMVSNVRILVYGILADALDRGLVAQNVLSGRQRQKHAADKRKGKLKVGIDIPSPDEIRRLLAQLEGYPKRAAILTAVFTGLRASELRGLRWADVDLEAGELHVRQRADCFNTIGRLKSEAGERTVPLPPIVVNTLRGHKTRDAVRGTLDLVFPNSHGKVDPLSNLKAYGLRPALVAAGIINADGKAKYGMHALRHFYASWCINRKVDGGLELPLKVVQARLGHASIQMTADVYGHLFPSGDDGAEMAVAEKALLTARKI